MCFLNLSSYFMNIVRFSNGRPSDLLINPRLLTAVPCTHSLRKPMGNLLLGALNCVTSMANISVERKATNVRFGVNEQQLVVSFKIPSSLEYYYSPSNFNAEVATDGSTSTFRRHSGTQHFAAAHFSVMMSSGNKIHDTSQLQNVLTVLP